MAFARSKTGISGLDEMLGGGIPYQHHVLVCGGPGTGKTLFGIEYLYRGAKLGEKGVLISLEEDPDRIVGNVKATFPKWNDLDQLIKDKKLFIIKPDKYDFKNFSDILQSYITQHKVKRVVIDSSTILKLSFENMLEFRKMMVDFLSFVGNLECTVLMTAEMENPVRGKLKFSVEQFVADGVILLYNLAKGEKRLRALEILKMRGTEHSQDLVPLKITPTGIKIFIGEKVY